MIIHGLMFAAGFVTGGVAVFLLLTVFADALSRFFDKVEG